MESAEQAIPHGCRRLEGRQTVIVIAQVKVRKRDGRQSANVIEAAPMAVTQHWIPTESNYEKFVAEKLVGWGRAFNKPATLRLG